MTEAKTEHDKLIGDRAEALRNSSKQRRFSPGQIAGVILMLIGGGFHFMRPGIAESQEQAGFEVPRTVDDTAAAPARRQMFQNFDEVPNTGPSALELEMQRVLANIQALAEKVDTLANTPQAGTDPALTARIDDLTRQTENLSALVNADSSGSQEELLAEKQRRDALEMQIAQLRAQIATANATGNTGASEAAMAHLREIELLKVQADLEAAREDRTFRREQASFTMQSDAERQTRILEAQLAVPVTGNDTALDHTREMERLRLSAQIEASAAARAHEREKEMVALQAGLADDGQDAATLDAIGHARAMDRLRIEAELEDQRETRSHVRRKDMMTLEAGFASEQTRTEQAIQLQEQFRAEQERARAQIEAERKRLSAERASAGIILDNSRGGSFTGSSSAGTTQVAALSPTTRYRKTENELFLDTKFQEGVETAMAVNLPNPESLIPQGTFIPGVLETAINSDLPGGVRAVVTDDVWSADASRILMPKGTRLIGQYRSGLGVGDTRLLMVWTRAITPDHRSLMLGSTGTDALGRGGVGGFVDAHFSEKFEAALLTSIALGLSSAGSTRLVNETAAVNDGLSAGNEAVSDAVTSTLDDYLSIPPTIHVDQGTPIQVFVQRDLYL